MRLQRVEIDSAQPGAFADAEGQRQPIRGVHNLLVLNPVPGDLRGQAVVTTGDVRPRIVDPVRMALRSGPSGGEKAIAERAQRFASTLTSPIESLVDQVPARHVVTDPLCRREGLLILCTLPQEP